MKSFFRKPYLIFLLFIIFFELLSFLGHLVPFINRLSFFLISFGILALSLFKLEYGIFALLAELFIGSKGYLFYLTIGPVNISVRMVLYSIVMVIWLIGVLRKKYKVSFLKSKFSIFYFLFFIFLFWGILSGLIYKNSKDLIFFDVNAWLYFLLIFPLFDILREKTQIESILKILSAAVTWLAIKTFILFFIFTHQIPFIIIDLYRWTRRSGLGEITQLDSFYRIFFQSQIYSLIGYFIFFAYLVFLMKKKECKFYSFLPLFLPTLPILVSFSRSFWSGFIVTLIIFLAILKIKEKFSYLYLVKIFSIILLIFIISFSLIWLSLKLPPKVKVDLASLVEKRMELEEPAASSRLLQLPYLLTEISEKPFFGSGFGKTVSYFSRDPRILGLYTTYAFEWGYLDIWLKIGLVGLFFFFLLLWKIFRKGLQQISNQSTKQSFVLGRAHKDMCSGFQQPLIFGLLMGLIALLVTHITSPYLNHPLGIGYLILCTVIFNDFV